MKKIKVLLVPLALIILAFLLRVWHYEYFPIGGETADESAWTMLGASLIQTRIPASWSFFAAYQNYHYLEGLYQAPIVRPVLDQPPLFALLPGAAHSLKSTWLALPSFKVIRLPLVLLGTINVALFWLVAQKFFLKKNWALFATLLFATIPSLVFGSRLVLAENLLVTWSLLALWLSFALPNRKTFLLLIGVGAAAVFTKVAGLTIPVSLVLYGLMMKKKVFVQTGLIGAIIGLGLFALYGAVYNWPLFVSVFLTQSARDIGLATLQNRLFLHPTLVKHVFFDGWKILGLFALVFSFGKKPAQKNFLLVQIMAIVSLLFIALTVGESTFHGWYDLMLWPMLVLAIGRMVEEIVTTSNMLLFGVVWLLLLPTLRLALVATDQYLHVPSLLMRGIVLAGFLPLGWQVLGWKRLMKITLVILAVVVIASNLIPVFFLTHDAYWLQAAFFEVW